MHSQAPVTRTSSLRWSQRILVAFAVVFVSACQTFSGATELSNGLHVPRSSSGIKGVGNAGLLEGTVVDQNGCLAIQDADPAYVTVPVFDVKDKRPDKLRVGNQVSLQGGVTPSQNSFEISEECAGEEDYFLVVRE